MAAGEKIPLIYSHLFNSGDQTPLVSIPESGSYDTLEDMASILTGLIKEDEYLVNIVWALHAHAEQMITARDDLVNYFSDSIPDILTELSEDDTGTNYGIDILQNLSEIQLGSKAYALAAAQAEIDNPHSLTADGDSGSMNFSSAVARGDFLSNNDIAAMKLFLNSSRFYSQPTTPSDSYALQSEGGDDIIVLAVGLPIGMVRSLEYPELDLATDSDSDALVASYNAISLAANAVSPGGYRQGTRKAIEVVVDIQNLQYPTLIFDSKSYFFDPRLFLSPYCWDQLSDIFSSSDAEGSVLDGWAPTLSDAVSSWSDMWGSYDPSDADGFGDELSLTEGGVHTVLPFYMITFDTSAIRSASVSYPNAPAIMDGAWSGWYDDALGEVAHCYRGTPYGSTSIEDISWMERFEYEASRVDRCIYNHAVDDILKKYYKFTYGIDFSESGFPSNREFNKTMVDEAVSATTQGIWEASNIITSETEDTTLIDYSAVVGDAVSGYHEVLSFSDYAVSDLVESVSSAKFSFIRNFLSSRLHCPEASARNALSAKIYERTFLLPIDPSTFIVNIADSTITNDDGTTLAPTDLVPDTLRNVSITDEDEVVDSDGTTSFTIGATPTSFYTVTATVRLANWS